MGPSDIADSLHETRRGIDVARGPDRDEEIAALQCLADATEGKGHLSEPHDMRPKPTEIAALRAGRRFVQVPGPGKHHRSRAAATNPSEITVHMNDLSRARPLVQVIDVLGYEQHFGEPGVLQANQRPMGSIGDDSRQRPATGIVEVVDEPGVAREPLWGRNVVDVVLRPDAVGIAKRRHAGIGRDPGARQDDYALKPAHAPPVGRPAGTWQAAVMIARLGVLFVCLGNICRSPTAEGVFRQVATRHGLISRLEIDSAGTGAWHIGSPPDRRSQAAALRRGIDLSRRRARQVADQDFVRFDYILAMDRANLAALSAMAPTRSAARVSLFLPFARDLGVDEVPDPYDGGPDGFEHVLELIAPAAEGLIQHVRGRLSSDGAQATR